MPGSGPPPGGARSGLTNDVRIHEVQDRRRRWGARACAALVVGALALLAGCSEPEAVDPEVTVSGDAGQAPTLTYVTPLVVDETYRETIWPGTGPEVSDGEPVLIDYWLEDADDASLVQESFTTSPTSQILTREDLGPELYTTIVGQRVGARLLQVAPGEGAGSYPTVTVIDVLPTVADGDAVEPREDLPKVTQSGAGAPKISTPKGDAPVDLVAQPVLRGTGRQVGPDDTVTVQYTGWAWTTGEEFDSTWAKGLPLSFSLQDVPAWSEGLTDQTVGSRVLLVVPPTYALGVTQSAALEGETVVFVVDVLDSRAPQGAS